MNQSDEESKVTKDTIQWTNSVLPASYTAIQICFDDDITTFKAATCIYMQKSHHY